MTVMRTVSCRCPRIAGKPRTSSDLLLYESGTGVANTGNATGADHCADALSGRTRLALTLGRQLRADARWSGSRWLCGQRSTVARDEACRTGRHHDRGPLRSTFNVGAATNILRARPRRTIVFFIPLRE